MTMEFNRILDITKVSEAENILLKRGIELDKSNIVKCKDYVHIKVANKKAKIYKPRCKSENAFKYRTPIDLFEEELDMFLDFQKERQ